MNSMQRRRLARKLHEVLGDLDLVVGDFGSGAAPSVGAVYTDADTVKRVQKALKLSPDGVIGPKTRAAIKAFNEKRGAPQDGESITDGVIAAVAGLEYQQKQQDEIPVYGPPLPAGYKAPAAVAAPTATSPALPTGSVAATVKKEQGIFGGIPAWQIALAGLGVLSIGAGAALLLSGRKH